MIEIVNRPAEHIENLGDPRGQFGRYLRHLLAVKKMTAAQLAEKLGKKKRAVQTWTKGQSGPAFADLDNVAKALGFRDWSKLAEAVVKFQG